MKEPTEAGAGDSTTGSNENPLRAVHADIGRLVLLYQHLDLMCKALMPSLQAAELAALDGVSNALDHLLDSPATMQRLIECLKDASETAEPQQFSAYLGRVSAQRKELMHQFTLLDFGGLDTAEKCSEAAAYLQAQYEFALPLRGVLLALVRSMMKQPAHE